MAAVMHHAEREKEGRTEGGTEGGTGRGRGKAVMEARLKAAQVAVKECYNCWYKFPFALPPFISLYVHSFHFSLNRRL